MDREVSEFSMFRSFYLKTCYVWQGMLQHKQMSETKRLLFHFMNERRLEYLIRACETKKKKGSFPWGPVTS